ncbi:hypothetical protein E3W66_07045 [Gammaproteobacteria bacterium LSUCC0057]|uniref:Uncharacterized protein n=1 Tax=Gammaproteobacteria bacterium LSUCC0057 TaxID=2559237 RepID=A0A4Y8UL30_9GAMM|nr:hypothetical protein E3W66_07045 [Gammaproteobacteria bacterium LSUCC0057]
MVAYLLKNIANAYLDKSGEWQTDAPRAAVAQFRHRDEALNLLVELNAKYPDLRAAVIEVQLDDKQRPIFIDDQQPARNHDCIASRFAEPA